MLPLNVPLNVILPAVVVHVISLWTLTGVPQLHSITRISAVIAELLIYNADALTVPEMCKALNVTRSETTLSTSSPEVRIISLAVGNGCL